MTSGRNIGEQDLVALMGMGKNAFDERYQEGKKWLENNKI
jgi:hypothetical protein